MKVLYSNLGDDFNMNNLFCELKMVNFHSSKCLVVIAACNLIMAILNSPTPNH